MEYPKIASGEECQGCKKDIDGKPYRCQACPTMGPLSFIQDPKDATKCMEPEESSKSNANVDTESIKSVLRTMPVRRNFHTKDLLEVPGERKNVLNLDADEHINRVEAYHIEGGYLNDQLAKIKYFTTKDKIVSCYYDRVKYKTSKKVFEAPEGEHIVMVK